jgi:hypothetical protein
MSTDFLDPRSEHIRAPGGIVVNLHYLLKASPGAAGSLRYLAVRKIYEKSPGLMRAQTDLASYNRDRSTFERCLAEMIPNGIDAIACVPSSVLSKIISPYRDAIVSRFPDIIDLTKTLTQQPGNASNSNRSQAERLEAITFTPSCDWPATIRRIVLVDDVWQSGTSLASAAIAFQRQTSVQLEFVGACALWVVSENKGHSMEESLKQMEDTSES